jgi:hypothetical protein
MSRELGDASDSVLVVDHDAAGRGPTEAEVEADKALALKVAVGALTGLASLAGVDVAIIAAASAPIAETIATAALRMLGRRRVEHAAETLIDGAVAAHIPLDEFTALAVADDRRHELLARTLSIAQDTALRNKRRALGRALAAGVMGDDARINEELLFIHAVADIDEMHIRLLARMATPSQPPGWSPSRILAADPGLANGIYALLGTLELHGLIVRYMPGGLAISSATPEPFYNITEPGRRFLDRLAEGDRER